MNVHLTDVVPPLRVHTVCQVPQLFVGFAHSGVLLLLNPAFVPQVTTHIYIVGAFHHKCHQIYITFSQNSLQSTTILI